MIKILRGTLTVHEAINGFYLYGKAPLPEDDPMWTFVGVLGDGSDDAFYTDPGFDPNDEDDMYAEAYGFELVGPGDPINE